MNNSKSSTDNNKLSVPMVLFLVLFMVGTSLFSLYIYHRHATNSDRASQLLTTVMTDEYGRININDATYSDLMQVDGIGKEIANDIIEFRESYGIITDMNVLSKIDGIGDAKLEALKRHFFCYKEPSDFSITKATATTPAETASTTTTTTTITTTLPGETSEHTTTLSTTAKTNRPSSSTTTNEEDRIRRPVNINTATAGEISDCLLVDIEVAKEIVELRELIGGYDNTLEILYCDSVSDALYLELEDFLLI